MSVSLFNRGPFYFEMDKICVNMASDLCQNGRARAAAKKMWLQHIPITKFDS